MAWLPEPWRKRLLRWRKPAWLYFLSSRTTPLSNYAGRERGQPIDRFYINSFLAKHANDIRGHCLEVKDDLYTRQFGRDRVTTADVLDINPDNPRATVRGDLRHLHSIPDDTYDCFILTQTLQYIDDLSTAVSECRRILKPNGILLATLPCLGKLEGLEKKVAGNFWRFTAHAAKYLFDKPFGPSNVTIESLGNTRASLAFYAGLAQQDLPHRVLLKNDPAFAVIVTVRATKPGLQTLP